MFADLDIHRFLCDVLLLLCYLRIVDMVFLVVHSCYYRYYGVHNCCSGVHSCCHDCIIVSMVALEFRVVPASAPL